MIWLAGQLWPLLLLSALLGAAAVAVWGQRRVTVEEWQEVPVAPAPEPTPDVGPGPDPEPDPGGDPAPAVSVTAPVPVDADDPGSPFPAARPGEPAPWEKEELWSRPARVGAGGQARRPRDEWTEAAENWRSWADEATGRGFGGGDLGGTALDPTDRDLFAADRELGDATGTASAAGGAEHEAPFPASPASAPQPTGGTMGGMASPDADEMDDVDDMHGTHDLPHPDDLDGMDDLDDDEREAAEIRRMREQERRGEAE